VKTFYYVHTGHRIGLDRFRRAAAIVKKFQDSDITLLTSDFRIAQIAREYGIENCVGVDVVRNIPYIAENGDQLIFDSAEANPLMLEDMRSYFSKFIRISDNPEEIKAENEALISPYLEGDGICRSLAVDDAFLGDFTKDIELSYFFGDDDYEKDIQKHFDFIEGIDVHLQLGFYYFLDYEDMLKEKFKNYFEFEAYDTMIQRSKILLSASPQAIIDSLASGAKPIYFQRDDYPQDFLPLFEKLNIPIVKNYDKNHLSVILETINDRKYEKFELNSNKIFDFISGYLNL